MYKKLFINMYVYIYTYLHFDYGEDKKYLT